MMLRPRVLVTSLIIAVPAAVLVAWGVERARAADMELALSRVVRSQINAQVRERCESDPRWFLAGPLDGRPPRGLFTNTDPDALEPRPKTTPQPFELFAYDERFLGSSSAAPMFPREFRIALQSSLDRVAAPYQTSGGTGVQVGAPTGWVGGPCMYFLGRMEPPPGQLTQRIWLVSGLFVLFVVVGALATSPTVVRTRRLAKHMRESAAAGYSAIAPDKLRDELSSLTFMFNDAMTELHQRKTRIDDQDESLKRLVKATDEEIAKPLAALVTQLGAGVSGQAGDPVTANHGALIEAHDLVGRVENLTAAARLKLRGTVAAGPIDLSELVSRVVSAHRPVANARGVAIDVSLPNSRVSVEGDESLVGCAIANVVDNAVRYSAPGGRIRVALDTANSRFTLRVIDDGRGVSEEEFRGLTAIRRFRGDEGRNRRPGAPGLGLAIAREVADRSGLSLALKRRDPLGFEVEFAGPSKG